MSAIPPDLSVSFSEAEWLRFLTSERWRPNLLVSCPNSALEPVVARLMTACAGPLQVRQLPGDLNLPGSAAGTLLLWDVAQLTPDQQVTLHQWMDGHHHPQVISVTSARLPALVEYGQFHEALFYRLNVISLQAVVADSRRAGRTEKLFDARPPGRLGSASARGAIAFA